MEYLPVDYEALKQRGKNLSSYKMIHEDTPILLDGMVYKIFEEYFDDEKASVFDFLERWDSPFLMKILYLLVSNNSVIGYAYSFDKTPTLKKQLNTSLPLEKRLLYIRELLDVDRWLTQRGLLYSDYHSDNFLACEHIRYLDLESIMKSTMLQRQWVEGYLLELIMSIYLNYDITARPDNSNLRLHFLQFLGDSCLANIGDNIKFDDIFENMSRKTSGEVFEFRTLAKKL